MVNKTNYDFSGWATRNDIQCSDGRTIKQNAFQDQDGKTVPLVWNHGHSEVSNVLGHALLENREAGVYCYCSFNNTPAGQEAKELVQHGDISSLSIFANRLKQNGKDVIHGMIREVSLVLAGANPGAFIENIVAHDEEDGECAQIYNTAEEFKYPEDETVEHSCGNSEDEKKKELEHAKEQENVEMKDVAAGENEETLADVFETLNEKQKKVVYYMLATMANGEETPKQESNVESKQEVEHSDESNKEDKTAMKTNIFDKTNETKQENYFSHSEENAMIEEAKRSGSLKDVVLSHMESDEKSLAHSITDITNLYPEYQPVNKQPKLISRNMDWVSKVLNAVKKVPFARIKNTSIDVTADAARAKGYVTGNQKVEEVIVALKRTTDPQTVYKLQKIDRDYLLDITDFDVVAFMKDELNVMLDEELARAILVGDGRAALSNDKIDATKIRPILGDNSVYTVARNLVKGTDDEYTFAKNWIKDVIKSRKLYKGTGKPVMFMTEDLLSTCLLIEDNMGRCIYENEEQLAKKLRVSEIITVPVFDGVTKTAEGYKYDLMAMMVNLVDYTMGNNKGGEKSFFDDFDLNFNKYEYLLETRKSGALTTPYSAITWEEKAAVENVEG